MSAPFISRLVLGALLAAALFAPPASAAETLHVAPTGHDADAGSVDAPLATLTEALRRAGGDERIVLAPGAYPQASDSRRRSSTVTVEGVGADATSVAGLTIQGGQRLTFDGIGFTDSVSVQYHATLKTQQPATDISFTHADFTAPAGKGCFGARNAVLRLSVSASRFHDCTTGFGAGAGGPIPQSGGLTLTGNRFERFTTDAIQLGQWNDVKILDNVITAIADPAGRIHNDGIQLTGNDRRVTIKRNRISESRSQLILIQDAVGPIHDVIVSDNLLQGAGAVALQSQGATGAQFIHNTIWDAKDGGLWLTAGYPRAGQRVVPTDTVLTNNLTRTFEARDGATARLSAGNVTACQPWQAPFTVLARGVTCLPEPGFADEAAGDLRLAPEGPARAYGSPLVSSATDVEGLPRSVPVPGAFR